MPEQIFTIAANEIRALIREKTFLLLLLVFLIMTLFSTYIGWSTKTTTFGIYNASLTTLRQSGVIHLPANPFLAIPALAIFRNMIIYIFLIGALLAIIIGHRAFIRERKSGVTQLLFSKPVSKNTFMLGKITGIAVALFLIIMATFLISLFSTLLIPGQQLTISEVIKLFSFYLISLIYMLIFAMIGLTGAIVFSTESLALLVPIIIWVVVTFIFPELTTGQNPVSLLNPTNIAQTAPQGTFFTLMYKVLSPLSIEQHYTGISRSLLETQIQFKSMQFTEVMVQNGKFLSSLIFYLSISVILSFYAFSKYTVTSDKFYE